MARVFTITPGLENMGAMKTGGQGSVYKGRRIGEVITAIKILPTPIYSESADDKNFIAFQNEVDKLRKVNEQPNPNVVKILSSGLTESGNLPFIEMEFIKGPDLEELLKAPNEPVFTVKEVVKVAEQLSNALAHCHKLDVKHGDIKSNNVKFNTDTSNYVLLDFGLAIMSDEQRRSSLRQAGAIEFMAPEQNTGQMLFQTDVYSFGIVLFELLAGTVPFPLKDKGESARNEVRLAHMVTPLPDLLALREAALPLTWDDQKKKHEMQAPEWLLGMIYKCLEKKPETRFASGIQLHEFISEKSITADNTENAKRLTLLEQENQRLLAGQEQLQRQLLQYRYELDNKESELSGLKSAILQKDKELQLLKEKDLNVYGNKISDQRSVPKRTFFSLLIFTIAISAFLFFSFLRSRTSENLAGNAAKKGVDTAVNSATPVVNKSAGKKKSSAKQVVTAKKEPAMQGQVKQQPKAILNKQHDEAEVETGLEQQDKQKDRQVVSQQKPVMNENKQDEKKMQPPVETERKEEPRTENKTENRQVQIEKNPETYTRVSERVIKRYKIISNAYFYNTPDESTRRNSFIGPWENAVVEAVDERYGFIYVIIKNKQGHIFKGWLSKKALKLYSIQ